MRLSDFRTSNGSKAEKWKSEKVEKREKKTIELAQVKLLEMNKGTNFLRDRRTLIFLTAFDATFFQCLPTHSRRHYIYEPVQIFHLFNTKQVLTAEQIWTIKKNCVSLFVSFECDSLAVIKSSQVRKYKRKVGKMCDCILWMPTSRRLYRSLALFKSRNVQCTCSTSDCQTTLKTRSIVSMPVRHINHCKLNVLWIIVNESVSLLSANANWLN